MSYSYQPPYFQLNPMASGWSDASSDPYALFDPRTPDTTPRCCIDPALVLVDGAHRAKRMRLEDGNEIAWSMFADAGRPVDEESLALLFLQMAELLAPASYALVGHLTSNPIFVSLEFNRQLSVLCHTLKSFWTPQLLDLFAPFRITNLCLGPFRPWQDIGGLLKTFTNPANFSALVSLSISGAFVSPVALHGVARLPLEHLELAHASLDLAGVGTLAPLFATLSTLSLQGNAMIDDAALPFLSCFPCLIFLDLLGTFVTVPGLIKFVHRAPEMQPGLKNICPPLAVQAWLEAQGPVVNLSSSGKDVEMPLDADRLNTKAACQHNLALHLPAEKLPPVSWGLQRLRDELKGVLSSRLDQIQLMRYISAPPSTLRQARSLPDLRSLSALHCFKTPAELPDYPNGTVAAIPALVDDAPEPSPVTQNATPFTPTSTPVALRGSTLHMYTIPGCSKGFSTPYCRDRHVEKVTHLATGAVLGRGQLLGPDEVVFGGMWTK